MQHQWRSWVWRLRSPKDLRSWMELCKSIKKGAHSFQQSPLLTLSVISHSPVTLKLPLLPGFCPILLRLLLCFPMKFESYQYSPSMFLLCLVRVGVCYLHPKFSQTENRSWKQNVQLIWSAGTMRHTDGCALARGRGRGRGEGDGKGLEAGKIGFQSQLCHSSCCVNLNEPQKWSVK